MPDLVYFSSVSQMTARLVRKVQDEIPVTVHRIPLRAGEPHLSVNEPYILITPTYGDGAVPKQVIRFLNDPSNRALLTAVVGCGNTNFGVDFARAADVVAAKCGVPVVGRVELLGTREDVLAIAALFA